MKTLHSQDEMRVFAGKVASELLGGDVLGLSGDLGTGKTEFVRGLAEALRSKDSVKSPSFTLLNHYRLDHPVMKHLIHADLYRLEDAGSDLVSQIGLDEWLDRKDAVVIIEWPERLGDSVSFSHQLHFNYGEKETDRVVKF